MDYNAKASKATFQAEAAMHRAFQAYAKVNDLKMQSKVVEIQGLLVKMGTIETDRLLVST